MASVITLDSSDLAHYVYVWSDPLTLEPFYVGKGSKGRCLDDHGRRELAGRPHTVTVYPMSSEADALRLEKTLIAYLGRAVDGTGPLLNLVSGRGGTDWWTPEMRSSKSKKIQQWWTPERRLAFGQKRKSVYTPELRATLSQKAKASWTPERRAAQAERARKQFSK